MDTPSTLDPRRITPLSLTEQEVNDAYDQIEAGLLPANFFELCAEARSANVFGVDAPRDKSGNRTEQGIGSAFGQTRNSIDAYKKFCKDEPDFEKNVARMERELEQSNARRKVEAAAAPKRRAQR
jgi:hypothetical protein